MKRAGRARGARGARLVPGRSGSAGSEAWDFLGALARAELLRAGTARAPPRLKLKLPAPRALPK